MQALHCIVLSAEQGKVYKYLVNAHFSILVHFSIVVNVINESQLWVSRTLTDWVSQDIVVMGIMMVMLVMVMVLVVVMMLIMRMMLIMIMLLIMMMIMSLVERKDTYQWSAIFVFQIFINYLFFHKVLHLVNNLIV